MYNHGSHPIPGGAISAHAVCSVFHPRPDRVHYHEPARKRNALNYDLAAELKQVFEAAEKDESSKIIALKAEGKVFCAGADLEYLQRLQSFDYHDNLADSNHLMQLFHQIYSLKKVVIGQVHGHAVAGGCGLASACDFS